MGFLWLSTVPLTNATIAQIFGVQHLSMLGGFVFFSHQIGSFLGVWLGGYLYDINGNYDMVWYLDCPGHFCRRRQPARARAAIVRSRPPQPYRCSALPSQPCAKLWHRTHAGGWLAGAARAAAGGVCPVSAAGIHGHTANQVWACF
jgi:hypothetical protein